MRHTSLRSFVRDSWTRAGIKLALLLDLEFLDERRFPAESARALRVVRMRGVFALTTTLMVTCVVIASFIATEFYGMGRDAAILAWISAMYAICGYSFAIAVRRKGSSPKGSERSVWQLTARAAVLASFWTFLPLMLLPLASGYQLSLLLGVTVGIMVGGPFALSTVPRAAFAWLGISSASPRQRTWQPLSRPAVRPCSFSRSSPPR